jgi:prolipoprotein diacylglyceryl transferase
MSTAFIWNADPTIFTLGPLQLRYYGILFGSMLLIGYWFFQKQLARYGYSEKTAESYLIWGVLSVIIGARLVHCFFYEPDYYFHNPGEIIKVWKGGIASHGATLGLFLTAIWFTRANKMPFVKLGDGIVFAAALGATFVRLGNFMNSEIVGRLTDSAWGVKFLRNPEDLPLARRAAIEAGALCDLGNIDCLIPYWPVRYPSQLFEALGGLIVFIALILTVRLIREKSYPGIFSGIFLVGYFSFRFCIEFIKEFQEEYRIGTLLTMGQWLSLPFIAIGLWFIIRTLRNGPEAVPAPAAVPAQKENGGKKHKKK